MDVDIVMIVSHLHVKILYLPWTKSHMQFNCVKCSHCHLLWLLLKDHAEWYTISWNSPESRQQRGGFWTSSLKICCGCPQPGQAEVNMDPHWLVWTLMIRWPWENQAEVSILTFQANQALGDASLPLVHALVAIDNIHADFEHAPAFLGQGWRCPGNTWITVKDTVADPLRTPLLGWHIHLWPLLTAPRCPFLLKSVLARTRATLAPLRTAYSQRLANERYKSPNPSSQGDIRLVKFMQLSCLWHRAEVSSQVSPRLCLASSPAECCFPSCPADFSWGHLLHKSHTQESVSGSSSWEVA